jgi:hypothetical protein
MVSRKSTKKTFWLLFFAIAVVILLGLFFYFYSGVYEGAKTKIPYSKKFYDSLSTNGKQYYDSLPNETKNGINNFLNNVVNVKYYDKLILTATKMTKQKNYIQNFSNAVSMSTKNLNPNDQFNLFFYTIKNEANLISVINSIKNDIDNYVKITPNSNNNYEYLLINMASATEGKIFPKMPLTIRKFAYDLIKDEKNRYSNNDIDYKSIYYQILYFLQFISKLSNDDFNLLYKNIINNSFTGTSYLFYIFMIKSL